MMSIGHKFTYLHEWLEDASVHQNIVVQNICDHSLEVEPGDVFIDLSHDVVVGEKNIVDALARGAVAVLTSYSKYPIHTTVPIVVVPGLKDQAAYMAASFYDNPSQKMQLVAITGTNGKTTSALLMMLSLQTMGVPAAYIGTLGFGMDIQQLTPSGLTTPSAVKLQKILHNMYMEGIEVVVMEVSSHALVQQRVAGCSFDVAIFTNLSRDHLDYHQSMFDYAQAKKRLFTKYKVFSMVINIDDEVGKQFEKELEGQIIPFTFTQVPCQRPCAHLQIVHCDKRGTAIAMECPWGVAELVSPLMGDFNANNLASAWLGLIALGYDMQESAGALGMIKSIPGRFEMYRPSVLKPTVVIDYAHTPSALEVVLKAVRALTKHHVWVVFGCGGNRDRGKRALMGQVAERLADRVLLTSDNSREEDTESIIADILKGMICPWAVEIETDRSEAIKRVVSEAKVGDIVLIAGKGHEQYQITKNQRLIFSDKAHVLNALGISE